MRSSRVLRRWREGKAACCTAVTFTDPVAAELTSLLGFDCIWLDLEHHAVSVERAADLMRAIRCGGSDVMARPAKGEWMRMGRLLEAGAQGILYPRCEDADEAREVVRWSRFAPLGERGFDGGGPDAPYGMVGIADYVRRANEETFLAVQIESPAAARNAREIAEVEGVDMLFFGPADYSILAGVPGRFDSPEVRGAVETICRETIAAGKQFGTLVFDADQARRVLDMGGRFIARGADLPLLRTALEGLRDELESLGFAFGG